MESGQTDAQGSCAGNDANAVLAVIDTDAKRDHVASLGLFAGVTA